MAELKCDDSCGRGTTPECEPTLQSEKSPQDLIAFKWAETLSAGEQDVLLTSSLRRLQNMIDSRAPVVAPQDAITMIEALRSQWQQRADAAPLGTYRDERFPMLQFVGAANEILALLRSAAPSPPSSPVPPEQKICVCGHPRIDHRFYSDHDECLACKPVEGTENDGLCCEFRAATPTPVEQEQNWWCKRQPWACRYQDAQRCAHDTMLGAECPRACECECHDPATTPTPVVEQERVQCADCLAWITRDANHACRQQVRRNQRGVRK